MQAQREREARVLVREHVHAAIAGRVRGLEDRCEDRVACSGHIAAHAAGGVLACEGLLVTRVAQESVQLREGGTGATRGRGEGGDV